MRKLLLGICFSFIHIYGFSQVDSLVNELNKHPQEDTIRFNLLRKIAYQYSFTDPVKGVEAANSAIDLAKKLNSSIKVAAAYSNKATNLHKLGKDSDALALYRTAVSMHLNADNKKGVANAYFNIAYVYFDIGNYYLAIVYELKAVELYKILNLVSDEADAYNSIADSYMRLDDYPSALKNFMQALNIYQQLNLHENEAMVLSNIGMTYHALADSAKAFMYYQKALKIDEQIQNKTNLAHDYQHIGVLYDDADKPQQALLYYQKALALNQEINDNRNIAGNLINIATTYSKLKDYSSAYKNINDALDIYKVLTDNYNVASLLNEKGKLIVDCPAELLSQFNIQNSQRYSAALNFQQQALQLAKQTKSYSLISQILQDISETYLKNNAFSKALEAYKQSIVLRDFALNDDQKKAITQLEMQYDFDKKETAVKTANDKEQALAKQEISKQKLIKNISILSGLILIIASLTSFVFYQKKKNALIQKKEADFNSQVIETEMKALRAQMNPHFIFNSLNSIADYIDKNQTETATEYTAKFAKLMRLVLENSEYKEISLSDDLNALELYIQLECLRLQRKFSYGIYVDNNIDKENTLVPPLILQPFVENAIWHGIAQKHGYGKIKIFIKLEDEMLSCIVEDDGGGIKENSDINTQKKSLGMKITKARIDIINQQKKSNASVNIFNQNKGVRAEVKLPLELNF